MSHTLSFPNAQSLQIEPGANLSVVLDVQNSPILFGCRTGICATCLVKVLAGHEHLPPISENEQEVLDVYADDPTDCRLACQLTLTGDVTLEYVGH